MKKKELTISEVARKGGMSTLKKYGKEKMLEWSKKGNEARRLKVKSEEEDMVVKINK